MARYVAAERTLLITGLHMMLFYFVNDYVIYVVDGSKGIAKIVWGRVSNISPQIKNLISEQQ